MIEQIKRVISEFLSTVFFTKYGQISAYNPNDYTVKVIIQPQGIETGFIPLAAIWVGNELGAVFGPAIGDSVRLDFIDGSIQATVVSGRFFNNGARPPVVQSGQAALVDSKGSYIRLNNDGTITLGAPIGITSTTPLLKQVGNMEVDGNVVVTQNITSDQNILAVGTLSDLNGQHGTVGDLRNAHNNHTHGNVQTGTGNSSGPSITV